MKRIRFLSFLFLTLYFLSCSSPEVQPEAPVAQPVATPEPVEEVKPLNASALDAEDESYALYLEKILAKMPEGREEKLLLNYIRYLHYKKPEYADGYVGQLVKEADLRDGLVPGVTIFEAPFILCHFENQKCVKSIGDLTRKYLIPRAKNGELPALEILVMQSSLIDNDDIEAEALQEQMDDPSIKAHSAQIKSIKKKHRKILSKSF